MPPSMRSHTCPGEQKSSSAAAHEGEADRLRDAGSEQRHLPASAARTEQQTQAHEVSSAINATQLPCCASGFFWRMLQEGIDVTGLQLGNRQPAMLQAPRLCSSVKHAAETPDEQLPMHSQLEFTTHPVGSQ